jgi:transposase
MSKKLVVGIDVGKEGYAVSVFDGQKYPFQGFTPAHPETFLKRITPHLPEDREVLFVMEATGVYSLKLALFLVKKGYQVSVANPFVVKERSAHRSSTTFPARSSRYGEEGSGIWGSTSFSFRETVR